MQKAELSCGQTFLSKAIDVINNLLKNNEYYIPWYVSGEFMSISRLL